MPPRSTRPQSPGHVVTAVVVTHDGMRWLPACLDALTAQVRPPQRVVAVDTGSTDGSADVLATALGEAAVVRTDRTTGLGAAVQAGLDAFEGAPPPPGSPANTTEWVWVLHDDCAPEPDALAELLRAAEDSPSVAAFGPKVTSSDGRLLVEVGRTLDSSGRQRTGLEPREVDQGQHDDVGDVLAASTAGLLVRRDVWDAAGGLDAAFPLFSEDLDFGWRLNAAGERLRIAPRAVVRHASALTAGERPADAVPGRAGAAARANGMQVVLANTSPLLVPVLVLRYVVECVVNAAALVLIGRRPGAARDEIVALGRVLGHLGGIPTSRRRPPPRTVPHRELRSLLAPAAWRWRRAGDALAALFAGQAAAELRSRRRAPIESGPVADEAESLDLGDSGVLLRLVRRPGVLFALVLVVVGLVGSRHFLGGTLHGGRLLPAPGGAGDLWSAYRADWHPVGLGSTATAPPYLAVLALLSSVLLGKVWLATAVLLLGALPLCGLAAYAAAGAVTRSVPLRLWGAAAYALLPAVSGAVAAGRIDVVLALVLLPLAARAVAGALRRGGGAAPAAFGAGLLLAAACAAAPVIWLVAVAVVVVAAVLSRPDRGRLLAAGVVLAVPPLTLLPWTITVIRDPALMVAGAGLPEQYAPRLPLGPADLLLMHPGGPGLAAGWLMGPLLLAGLIGLLRRRGAAAARGGLLLVVAGLGTALVVSRLSGPRIDGIAVHYWTGVPLAIAGLGAILAATIAAERARPALRAMSFGWRQPAAVVLAAAVGVGTAGLTVHWLARGPRGPITAHNAPLLPVFAAAQVGLPTRPRALLLTRSARTVDYALVRDPAGLHLGDADVAGSMTGNRAAAALTTAVRRAAAGQSAAVPELDAFGVGLVVVPRADARGLTRLADVDGLTAVPTRGAVVWRTSADTGELVVLPPAASRTAAQGRPTARGATPLRFPRTGAVVRVAPGPTGRLLVLAERTGGWSATIGGHQLPGATAYGWAQAWRLPAAGGELRVTRHGRGRGWWLLGELLAVVGCGLAALPGGRRADRKPGREAAGSDGPPGESEVSA
ncbi:MAG: glycosyltransferase family 2 protein [Frankiales bacterium]|nr:glycosyltransferase family 2 protein [Frankiales bacterium]